MQQDIMEHANILMISDNDSDYNYMINRGFYHIDRLYSLVGLRELLKRNMIDLSNYDFIVIGNDYFKSDYYGLNSDIIDYCYSHVKNVVSYKYSGNDYYFQGNHVKSFLDIVSYLFYLAEKNMTIFDIYKRKGIINSLRVIGESSNSNIHILLGANYSKKSLARSLENWLSMHSDVVFTDILGDSLDSFFYSSWVQDIIMIPGFSNFVFKFKNEICELCNLSGKRSIICFYEQDRFASVRLSSTKIKYVYSNDPNVIYEVTLNRESFESEILAILDFVVSLNNENLKKRLLVSK